jgi:diguanylate cyclase (GGDEF)-like protein
MTGFLRKLATPIVLAVVAPILVLIAVSVAFIQKESGWEFWPLAFLGFLVSVLAGFATYTTAARFTNSVEQVTNALLGLADGNFFGSTLDVPEAEETAPLVEAFNRMSARLSGSVDALARSQREFRRAVARLGDALAGSHNLPRILEVVLETALLLLDGDQAVFYEVNPSRTRVEARVSSGGVITGAVESGTGLAGTVAARGRSLRFASATPIDDAKPVPPEPDCHAALAVPVFGRGAIFGVVAVYGTNTGIFGHDDVETLEALVRQAETAIDNVFLHEEAQRLSITDGLTGLWNRREFDLRARQEVDRATRYQRKVALIMCDLDRFKKLNDTWGHQGGDAVLVELSERLKRSTREIDWVVRYGGEEFALVVPETDLEHAVLLAERIRLAVAETPFEFDGHKLAVTVSLGVAAYPDTGQSVRELVTAADAALYEAKRGGRNQVRVAPVIEPPEPPTLD